MKNGWAIPLSISLMYFLIFHSVVRAADEFKITASIIDIYKVCYINADGDGKIGMTEAIYILQKTVQMRDE